MKNEAPTVPYAEQVREVLRMSGRMNRIKIRQCLPRAPAKSVNGAIDGLARKRKLARENEPVRFPDGSTRACAVYSLKQGR